MSAFLVSTTTPSRSLSSCLSGSRSQNPPGGCGENTNPAHPPSCPSPTAGGWEAEASLPSVPARPAVMMTMTEPWRGTLSRRDRVEQGCVPQGDAQLGCGQTPLPEGSADPAVTHNVFSFSEAKKMPKH